MTGDVEKLAGDKIKVYNFTNYFKSNSANLHVFINQDLAD